MSTLPTPSPESVPPQPPPSRPVLDDKKKAKIVALVANGSSRRMAAQYVGCAPSTITRTYARDPQFREQLAAAEQNTDVEALRALRVAARKPRYWRAAAWLLERRHPDEFARRQPNTYTPDEVARCVGIIMEVVVEDLPEENYQRAIKKIDELREMTREDYQALCDESPKMPDLEKEWAEAERQRLAEQQQTWNNDDDEPDDDDFADELPPISAVSPLPVDTGRQVSAVSPLPVGEGPGVRAEPQRNDSPLVQHPSSEETPAPFPALAVTSETPYTSELSI